MGYPPNSPLSRENGDKPSYYGIPMVDTLFLDKPMQASKQQQWSNTWALSSVSSLLNKLRADGGKLELSCPIWVGNTDPDWPWKWLDHVRFHTPKKDSDINPTPAWLLHVITSWLLKVYSCYVLCWNCSSLKVFWGIREQLDRHWGKITEGTQQNSGALICLSRIFRRWQSKQRIFRFWWSKEDCKFTKCLKTLTIVDAAQCFFKAVGSG